jgi:hypothetical protein
LPRPTGPQAKASFKTTAHHFEENQTSHTTHEKSLNHKSGITPQTVCRIYIGQQKDNHLTGCALRRSA